LSGVLQGCEHSSLPCLLRALLVAVPAGAGRVARLELLMDGRVVLQAPGAVAAMHFEAWVRQGGGSYDPSRLRHYAHYCLALGAFQCPAHDVLPLCGELDLTAPGARDALLQLRVVYGPHGAPQRSELVVDDVFVQACMLM
jgi:hypothetical protein